MRPAHAALLPALLALSGCMSWWIERPCLPGALPPDAPVLRVAVVAPELPRQQDLRLSGWQALPLEMTAPLSAPVVPGLLVLSSGQKQLQHDPISRALHLVSLPDPAVVARDAFVEAWNAAGHLPRAQAVTLPPLDRHDAGEALAAPGAGPMLLLGTTTFDLHWRYARTDLTVSFSDIPPGPPDFRFAAYVSAALLDEAGREVLWCSSELVPAPWSTSGYTRREAADVAHATLAQWTSGGGVLLAQTAEHWGRARGVALAELLAAARAEAEAPAPEP